MVASQRLKDAVAAKDMATIRDCLWAKIVLDPNFTEEFAECWDWCLRHGVTESELYERHDGRPLSEEATEDNFNELCGQLATNFSRKRLDAAKCVGRILYPPRTGKAAGGRKKRGKKNPAVRDRGRLPYGLIVASALGGGVLGGLLFKKAVAGAIVGALAVVAAGAWTGTKKKS